LSPVHRNSFLGGKPMPEILYLSLHREFFDAIARKRKRIEYRKQCKLLPKRAVTGHYRGAHSAR
jgi:hypothetical protein